MSELPAFTCPQCGDARLLVIARVAVQVHRRGEHGTHLAQYFGNAASIPVTDACAAICNRYGCDWKGTLADAKPIADAGRLRP